MITKLGLVGTVCALGLLSTGVARGELTGAEQKCIDGYNNKLRLVSQQAGKSARACIKNAAKGDELDPDGCIVNLTDGKVADKQLGVADLYTIGTCSGDEPIQQGATIGNDAHADAITDLAHDLFGDPVSSVVSPDKPDAKCQDKAFQRATQAFTEFVKGHRKCAKDAMKAGSADSSAALETACGSMSQIDPGSKVAGKLQKISDDVGAACASVSLSTRLPGLDTACHGGTAAAANCIRAASICRACEAVNRADGTEMDCDVLDNGAADATCGIPMHTCVLDTVPASDSQIRIHIAALPAPLTFSLSGVIDIGGNGNLAACEIQFINPVNIPSIGAVCITPGGFCKDGYRHCGPGAGPPLGIEVNSDGNAGACTGNAQCAATAAAACAPDDVLASGCTGHCSGPTAQVCTNDADCAGNGACNGPDGLTPSQRNLCQISCLDLSANSASAPGDLQCNLGATLVVESAAPCNGTDTLIDAGASCIPFATERAASEIVDANFMSGSIVPPPPNVNDVLGQEVSCPGLDGGTLTGLRAVGAINFFGSALGDLAVGIKATCN